MSAIHILITKIEVAYGERIANHTHVQNGTAILCILILAICNNPFDCSSLGWW